MPGYETSTGKIRRRLMQEGWVLERHGAAHDVYVHATQGTIILPRHRTLSAGVARSIAKAAGWL